MNYVLRRLVFTPERLFISALERTFPGSEWVITHDDVGLAETLDSSAQLSAAKDQPSPASTPLSDSGPSGVPPQGFTEGGARAVAVVGGTKFDPREIDRWVSSLPLDTIVVTGDGRGAEQEVRKLCAAAGLRVDVPAQHPDSPPELSTRKEMLARLDSAIAYGKARHSGLATTFGKSGLDCQVESILASTSGPIVLVGAGGRVKLAKQWLRRGKWGREVLTLE